MLRHRGVRGVAPVQPGDGGDVPRRPEVCLLGQLPSYRESIRDYRGLPVPKIRREPTMIVAAYRRLLAFLFQLLVIFIRFCMSRGNTKKKV